MKHAAAVVVNQAVAYEREPGARLGMHSTGENHLLAPVVQTRLGRLRLQRRTVLVVKRYLRLLKSCLGNVLRRVTHVRSRQQLVRFAAVGAPSGHTDRLVSRP